MTVRKDVSPYGKTYHRAERRITVRKDVSRYGKTYHRTERRITVYKFLVHLHWVAVMKIFEL